MPRSSQALAYVLDVGFTSQGELLFPASHLADLLSGPCRQEGSVSASLARSVAQGVTDGTFDALRVFKALWTARLASMGLGVPRRLGSLRSRTYDVILPLQGGPPRWIAKSPTAGAWAPRLISGPPRG